MSIQRTELTAEEQELLCAGGEVHKFVPKELEAEFDTYMDTLHLSSFGTDQSTVVKWERIGDNVYKITVRF